MYVSNTHEWVDVSGKIATIGISSDAASHIGEIVYIELPKIGSKVHAGEITCVLESSKSASDLYTPVSGVILAVNEAVKEDPSLINKSPEQKGWLFQIEMNNLQELDLLLPSSKKPSV